MVINDSGKKRLVIDLRHSNQYLLKDSFKYEDLRTAMLLFQKEDYLFSFDLKSGYHHVDIHKQHQKYLRFAWDMGHGLQHYMFKVLPFGLATACYIFTKLLRPLVKYWRSQGLRAIIYLDDDIVAVSGKEAAHKASHSVRTDLAKAGTFCQMYVGTSTKSLLARLQIRFKSRLHLSATKQNIGFANIARTGQ